VEEEGRTRSYTMHTHYEEEGRSQEPEQERGQRLG